VQRLINQGAVHIVVPGNPPTGCSPTILTFRQSSNAADYDLIGCLRNVNRVARYHNLLLRAAVGSLRGRYPHTRIIFSDFYEPIIGILQNPSLFGKSSCLASPRVSCTTGQLILLLADRSQ
jgi:phospholipase/lecithinase/hemolysin